MAHFFRILRNPRHGFWSTATRWRRWIGGRSCVGRRSSGAPSEAEAMGDSPAKRSHMVVVQAVQGGCDGMYHPKSPQKRNQGLLFVVSLFFLLSLDLRRDEKIGSPQKNHGISMSHFQATAKNEGNLHLATCARAIHSFLSSKKSKPIGRLVSTGNPVILRILGFFRVSDLVGKSIILGSVHRSPNITGFFDLSTTMLKRNCRSIGTVRLVGKIGREME